MKRSNLLFFGIFFGLFFCVVNISAQDDNSIGGVLNGKAISLPKPEYPSAARAVRAGGAVNVEVIIDEKGNVTSANAVSGHPLLRSSTEKAAKGAKFSPFKKDDVPVKVSGILVYNFTSAKISTAGQAASNDEEIYPEGEVLNGKATKLPTPVYSPAAKAVKASGTVKVQVTLDEKGNVISAKAISGHPLLLQSALKAAQAAKFSPTISEDKAVKGTGIVIYNFTAAQKENLR